MNIDEAARATRKYWVAPHWERQDAYYAAHDGDDLENVGELYGSCAEAQAACDRMNLRAVLEAIREPNTVMLCAGVDADDGQTGIERIKHIHRAMIDALIAEVGK